MVIHSYTDELKYLINIHN